MKKVAKEVLSAIHDSASSENNFGYKCLILSGLVMWFSWTSFVWLTY